MIRELFPQVETMRDAVLAGTPLDSITGKSVFLLFYEASTRTRVSFARAARLLGMSVDDTENAKMFSSALKGESLEDTIRVLCGYFYDLIVLRFDQSGGAVRAAKRSSGVPIVNAGDGSGEHPTQALLDLFTIQQHFGELKGLRVALVGDLFYSRTIHSLARLLAKIGGVELTLVSPSAYRVNPETEEVLERSGCKYRTTADLLEVATDMDVVYLTRLQKERLKEATERNSWLGEVRVCIDSEILQALPADSIILHPLPRSDDFAELPDNYDDDPRVRIFEQAQNGLFVRMALLKMIFT